MDSLHAFVSVSLLIFSVLTYLVIMVLIVAYALPVGVVILPTMVAFLVMTILWLLIVAIVTMVVASSFLYIVKQSTELAGELVGLDMLKTTWCHILSAASGKTFTAEPNPDAEDDNPPELLIMGVTLLLILLPLVLLPIALYSEFIMLAVSPYASF
jgi:hypothetical protein